MAVRLDCREALKQFNGTLHTHPCSPQRGEHTICTAQRASKPPQLEVTLQMFSADLVTHPFTNPLLKDILVYLGRDSEILHHCTLQTPVLACSLGYFDSPALFPLDHIPGIFPDHMNFQVEVRCAGAEMTAKQCGQRQQQRLLHGQRNGDVSEKQRHW